jgi:hypothetical protein
LSRSSGFAGLAEFFLDDSVTARSRAIGVIVAVAKTRTAIVTAYAFGHVRSAIGIATSFAVVNPRHARLFSRTVAVAVGTSPNLADRYSDIAFLRSNNDPIAAALANPGIGVTTTAYADGAIGDRYGNVCRFDSSARAVIRTGIDSIFSARD